MGLREYQRPPVDDVLRRLNQRIADIDWHLDLSRERLALYRAAGSELSLLVQLHVADRQLDARLEAMREVDRLTCV